MKRKGAISLCLCVRVTEELRNVRKEGAVRRALRQLDRNGRLQRERAEAQNGFCVEPGILVIEMNRFAIVANCAISFTEWNMMVNSLTENPPAMDCTIGSKSSIIILKKEEMLGLDSLLSSIIENGILYYPQKTQTFFVHNL